MKNLLHEEHIGAIRLDNLESERKAPQFQYAEPSANMTQDKTEKEILEDEFKELDKLAKLTKEVLDDLPDTFHEAVGYLRKKVRKLNQEEFAERIDISVRNLQRIESGEKTVDEPTLVKICLALELNFIIRQKLFELLEWNPRDNINRYKLKIILNDSYFNDKQRMVAIINRLYPDKSK